MLPANFAFFGHKIPLSGEDVEKNVAYFENTDYFVGVRSRGVLACGLGQDLTVAAAACPTLP